MEMNDFYKIPREVIKNKRYKDVSISAKLLYGILLDRKELSAANNWIDKQGRVYIFFTVESITEILHCSKGKAIKLLAELENAELIDRKKQGQHYPDIIYVNEI